VGFGSVPCTTVVKAPKEPHTLSVTGATARWSSLVAMPDWASVPVVVVTTTVSAVVTPSG
jgi:hypothetical protein